MLKYNYSKILKDSILAILLDFSQVVMSACYAFADELSVDSHDKESAKNIVRHVILSQIKYYKSKYGIKYGELIISCDGFKYWRRDCFPQYKACRKEARNKSNIDWKLIFHMMDELIHDLKENFPYKIIRIENCESDDIIATLTKYLQTHEIDSSNPLFDAPQNILIVSSDMDFAQLQKYSNVTQIAPKNKKKIEVDDPVLYLREKVIRGDSGDGIPSIVNHDEVFVMGERQKKITAKLFDQFMEEKTPENCTNETFRKNWLRNRLLIDFDFIPKDIEESIIYEYNQPIQGNKMKVFNYLIQHQCNQLLNDIDSF